MFGITYDDGIDWVSPQIELDPLETVIMYPNGNYGNIQSRNKKSIDDKLSEIAKQSSSCVYSDRLFQWDPKKYNELHQKHFGNHGQMWHNPEPEKTQEFLAEYLGIKLTLTCIAHQENRSSGYLVWIFFYKEIK